MTVITVIVLWSIFLSILVATSSAVHTITANQTIRDDGNSTIESAGGLFELGFFSPGNSKNRYLGIWYKKIATGTVVWVANRNIPLTDNSGVLRVNGKGILVLVDSTESIIWSSNFLRYMKHPVAELLDTGNLVIRDEYDSDPENFVWQSFDHPGDTLLPGMKIGWGLTMDLDRHLTSWESAEDPSPGDFILDFNRDGYPQLLLSQNSDVKFRFGPWNGNQFSGQPILDSSFASSFVLNDKEIYYIFDVLSSPASRMVLNPNGNIQLLTWIDRTQSWEINPSQPAQRDNCDDYAVCGAYGSCYLTKYQLGTCSCMKGYEPKNLEEWKSADWSGGCVRKTALNCSGDGFVKYSDLKLPETRQSWFNQSMSLEDCERVCLMNCSCTAYSNIDIKYGSGCLLWFGDLIDMRHKEENGQHLYIRLAASELEKLRSSRRKKPVKIIVIPVMVVLIIFLSLFLIHVLNKRRLKRKLRRRGILTLNSESASTNANEQEEFDIPLLDFERIVNATNNFSHKLGQGGFGSVYKGVLDGGQEIAVKRLSRNSKQGRNEFKNEVSCIAKLQHRNLVRLLGCCIEEGEMLLIYEYMPNKSLDSFIFDRELRTLLDWPKRYNIIKGIAKGLLYLHEDSRLRIIHRDLKASNVLLDYAMNPKISDFGMARSFGGNETEDNTRRIVGTYGYMSPEYVIDGLFSIKSDVYSFGVLLLEIVSGEKIRSFHHRDHNLNLLGSAWKLYEEGKFLELIDGVIAESCNQSELLRAIQIGLLCVQPYARDRPSMSFVVAMLSSETELPQPKQPGFFTARQLHESEPSLSKLKFSLCKELTVTVYAPR